MRITRYAVLLTLLTACGCVANVEPEKKEDPAIQQKIETTYISDDFFAAVVVHPARVMKGKMFSDFMAMEKEIGFDPLFQQSLQKVFDDFGADPRKIRQLVVLIDLTYSMKMVTAFRTEEPARGNLQQRNPPPIPAFILRYADAIDQKAVLKTLAERYRRKSMPDKQAPMPLPKIEIAGRTCYLLENSDRFAVCFIDDKTVIGAPEKQLAKMIVAKDVKTRLTSQLKTFAAEHDLILAADLKTIAAMFSWFGVTEWGPAFGKLWQFYAYKLQSVSLTASIAMAMPCLSICSTV